MQWIFFKYSERLHVCYRDKFLFWYYIRLATAFFESVFWSWISSEIQYLVSPQLDGCGITTCHHFFSHSEFLVLNKMKIHLLRSLWSIWILNCDETCSIEMSVTYLLNGCRSTYLLTGTKLGFFKIGGDLVDQIPNEISAYLKK